jgi:sec-independent protein translocase protein TatA
MERGTRSRESGHEFAKPHRRLFESEERETQMFLKGLEGRHVVVIAALTAVLFGAKRMPDASRSVGRSLRIFKAEMKAASTVDEGEATRAPDAAAEPALAGKNSETAGAPVVEGVGPVPASHTGTPTR